MVDENEYRQFAKEITLALLRIQEAVTALGIVLKEQRQFPILDQAGWIAALAMAEQMTRPIRTRMEKAETVDPMLEFLRGFQGPIQ